MVKATWIKYIKSENFSTFTVLKEELVSKIY